MQVLLGRLAACLGLLSAALLPLASGKPRPQPWAASNETHAVPGGAPVPTPGLGSWKAFLGLQRPRRLRVQGASLEVAPATISLPLDPQEVTQEVCKAVPFTQVLSRPGCSVARLRNHICFGQCTSVFVPGSDPASLALCNSCEPGRQRRAPVVLWCQGGGPVSTWRRVKMSTVLVNSCQCSPKP